MATLTFSTAALVVMLLTMDLVNARFVMPWLCAIDGYPCDNTMQELDVQIKQLATPGVFTDSATFSYILNSNGEAIISPSALIINKAVANAGVRNWAMIFATDVPTMRKSWGDIDKFINSVKKNILEGPEGKFVSGINFDWEPATQDTTQQDEDKYINFLDKVSLAMHKFNVSVSVCGIGPQSDPPFWNYEKLGNTSLDFIMDMNTYQDPSPPPSNLAFFFSGSGRLPQSLAPA